MADSLIPPQLAVLADKDRYSLWGKNVILDSYSVQNIPCGEKIVIFDSYSVHNTTAKVPVARKLYDQLLWSS